ncbi:MAG: hypothetical protein OXU76_04600, partial [Alphaproteobacteria bacterium]|nr:hypothetical protein [Alphaproteobacteria bacterium]
DVLQRNFYPDHEGQLDAQFADYVRRVEAYLAPLPLEVILSNDIFAQFPQGINEAQKEQNGEQVGSQNGGK